MDDEVAVDTIGADDPDSGEDGPLDGHLLSMNTEQDTMDPSTTNKTKAIKICGFVFLALLIIVIVSLVYVEYARINKDEKQESQSTRTNCSNTTFSNVTFSIPNNTFQRHDLYVSIANEEGVPIDFNISFWYRLPKENVSRIVSRYGENYETMLSSVTRAAVRNTAVDFSVNQFLNNRTGVRHHIAQSISYVCSEMWIECRLVRFEILFSAALLNTHLWAFVNLQNNLQKGYEKEAAEIRAETSKLVEEYLESADNITRMAEANKTAELEAAQAEYDEIIAETRYNTSRMTMHALGIVNSTVQETFLTLMGILDNTTYIP